MLGGIENSGYKYLRERVAASSIIMDQKSPSLLRSDPSQLELRFSCGCVRIYHKAILSVSFLEFSCSACKTLIDVCAKSLTAFTEIGDESAMQRMLYCTVPWVNLIRFMTVVRTSSLCKSSVDVLGNDGSWGVRY